MKKMIIVLDIILLVLTACNIKKEGENMKYRSVDMYEGLKMIRKDRGYVILDVRTKEEYDEGHIPGARNYPNEDIDEGFRKLYKDKEQRIYVYCRSGRRSKSASAKLAELEYTDIVEFGGILDYTGTIEKGN